MLRLAFLLSVLPSCQSCRELGGGAGLDLPFLDVVYECSTPTGTLELCYPGDADELAYSLSAHGYPGASCSPTSRHLGPCVHQCPSAKGCNAFAGCYCPVVP